MRTAARSMLLTTLALLCGAASAVAGEERPNEYQLTANLVVRSTQFECYRVTIDAPPKDVAIVIDHGDGGSVKTGPPEVTGSPEVIVRGSKETELYLLFYAVNGEDKDWTVIESTIQYGARGDYGVTDHPRVKKTDFIAEVLKFEAESGDYRRGQRVKLASLLDVSFHVEVAEQKKSRMKGQE